MSDWQDPWRWAPYRRMRRGVTMGSVLLTLSLLAFMPAAWILMAPRDPTLRPDLYREPAWIVLTLCIMLLFLGLRVSARARERFEKLMETATLGAREKAAKQDIDLDIDVADTYPPLMLSRRFGRLCVAGPDCLILPTDKVQITVSAGNKEGDGPPYPHVVLRFTGATPDHLSIAPADRATSLKQVELLAEKLHDQLDPKQNWHQPKEPAIDMDAFLSSMKPKR
jgi:hypothetical protein